MGGLFTKEKREKARRIWPVRSWYHAQKDEYVETKFENWNPENYNKDLKYPNQEPAKDY